MFFDNIYSLKLFSWLDKEVVDNILNNCETRNYHDWDVIITEWDESNGEWYIIRTWKVSISSWWKEFTTLNVGDIFWEIALLSEEPRTATVIAMKDLDVIVLKMENIMEIINNDENWLNKTIFRRIEENLKRREDELESETKNEINSLKDIIN
jgi:CRP-like cAMP-binding protein